MGKSHVAAWASDSPTPAQLKEFFAQIDAGRVTNARLQKFLRGNVENTTCSIASKILGSHFFPPRAVAEAVKPMEYPVTTYEELLPTEDQLRTYQKGDYIVLPGSPGALTVYDMRMQIHPREKTPMELETLDTVCPGWLVIRNKWRTADRVTPTDREMPLNVAELAWIFHIVRTMRSKRREYHWYTFDELEAHYGTWVPTRSFTRETHKRVYIRPVHTLDASFGDEAFEIREEREEDNPNPTNFVYGLWNHQWPVLQWAKLSKV